MFIVIIIIIIMNIPFQALSKIYESTNDRWRALGYQKAIAALKRLNKEVTSFEVRIISIRLSRLHHNMCKAETVMRYLNSFQQPV